MVGLAAVGDPPTSDVTTRIRMSTAGWRSTAGPSWVCGILMIMSLLAIALRARAALPQQQHERAPSAADQLQRRIKELSRVLQGADANGAARHQVDATRVKVLWAELATSLHALDTLHPDGGTRVKDAEHAYNSAIQWAFVAGDRLGALRLSSSLGALLMSRPNRTQDSLRWLDTTLKQALAVRRQEAGSNHTQQEQWAQQRAALDSMIAGVQFNRGKALATAGRLGESDAAFLHAAHQSHGRELSTYGKAVAALQSTPYDLLLQGLVVLRHLGHNVLPGDGPPWATHADSVSPQEAAQQRVGADLGGGPAQGGMCPVPLALTHLPAAMGDWQLLGQGLTAAHLIAGSSGVGQPQSPGGTCAALEPVPGHLWLARLSHDVQELLVGQAGRRRSAQRQQRGTGERPTNVRPGSDGGYAAERAWLHNPPDEAVAWLCFGIFKALDAHKAYAPAWRALELANRLMARVWPYDAQRDLQQLAAVQGAFAGPFHHLGRGHSDASPIFIVGAPRSGSTLLESLLAAHKDVVAAGEDTAMGPLTQDIKQVLMGTATDPDMPISLVQLGKRYIDNMCDKFVPPERRTLPAGGQGGVSCKGVHVVDKQLRNLWSVGFINLVLPQACIIHMARHPLDAGLSCFSQPFFSPLLAWSWDLRHIATFINMTWQLVEHWERALPGRVHTVHYEQLVEHSPEATLRRVLRICGLNWQPDLLSTFHAAQRSVSTASVAQVRKPLYASSIGRWRAYAEQLAPLREALGGTVQRYERRLLKALAEQQG